MGNRILWEIVFGRLSWDAGVCADAILGVGLVRTRAAALVLVPVKTLVIGSGGREHALALALSRDPKVSEVHVAPGNPGVESFAIRHEIDQNDGIAIAALAIALTVDFVVIGPEAPLVAGAADRVR